MISLKNYTIFPFVAILILLVSCQDNKSENTNSLPVHYDSLDASITIMKSYVRKLDNALLETANLEALLLESDSAKSALRSRDRDVVRMYEIEKTPIVDTLSEEYGDMMLKEANKILEEARYAIETTREQIEEKKSRYTKGEIDPERDITQEYQTQIKKSEKIISEAEDAAQKLQLEIDKSIKAH